MTRLEWPSFENLRRCVDPELGPVLEGSPTPAVPAPARVAASCACAQGPASAAPTPAGTLPGASWFLLAASGAWVCLEISFPPAREYPRRK